MCRLRGASAGHGVRQGAAHEAILPSAPHAVTGFRLSHLGAPPPLRQIRGLWGKCAAAWLWASPPPIGVGMTYVGAASAPAPGFITLLLQQG